jgi:hypothetical protein
MGKSMFARSVAVRFAQMRNMPTILITEAFVGVTDFIESIKQECVVLFDEFEKVFSTSGPKEGIERLREPQPRTDQESQEKLLGLFDGISQTKRFYIVSVPV